MGAPIYANPPTEEEKAHLERMTNSRTGTDLHRYKWAKIILLSAYGETVPKIASRVEEKRVRYRIHQWNERRLAALVRRKPPGRRRKLTEELGERLSRLATFGKLSSGERASDPPLWGEQVLVTSSLGFEEGGGILTFEGVRAVWVIWDNAKAHRAERLMIWLRGWNRRARERGVPRIIPVYLPVQAPWLNAIEGIFRGMYGAVIAGSDYGGGEEMRLAMERYFERRERELVEEMVREEVETIILN